MFRSGSRRAAAALLAALLLGASAGATAQAPPGAGRVARSVKPTPAPKRHAALRILALGDSYTIGEGVGEAQRWPEQLAAALEEGGLEVGKPQIIARTGWTTTDLAHQIERSELAPPYDLVTLLIGVNDQFQGYEEADYPRRFQALLDRAIALAGGDSKRVLVVSIPDYSVTPFASRFGPAAIHEALERYNAINRKLAGRMGVAHVDITPVSRKAADDPTLLAPDQLHPSAKMYREWVIQMLPAAHEALRAEKH